MSRDALAGLVGAGFGLVFVLANVGGLTPPLPAIVRVAAVLAFLAVAWVLLRAGSAGAASSPPPAPGALRVYLLSVTIEVVALVVGARLLGATGQEAYVLPWVVFVVGVHFLPFARAFATSAWARLGWAMIAVAACGAGVAAAGTGTAGVRALTGILAGVLMLSFGPLHARTQRLRPPTAPRAR